MIFIAYSWADAGFVHKFANHLKSIGESIWIDYEKINLRLDITVQIKKAIEESTALVCFESENSMKSNWVKLEKVVAKKHNKPIIILPISNSIYASDILTENFGKLCITGRCT